MSRILENPRIEAERQRIYELCRTAALELYGQCPEFSVSRPKDPGNGDFAASTALALGGALRRRPSEMAAEIAERIELPDGERVEVGGKGFLNFSLRPDFLMSVLEPVRELPYLPLPELNSPDFEEVHCYHRLRTVLELRGIKPESEPLTDPREVRLLWAIAMGQQRELMAAAMELYDKLGPSASRYILFNNALYIMYRNIRGERS